MGVNETLARRIKQNVVLDRNKQVTGCQRKDFFSVEAWLNQPRVKETNVLASLCVKGNMRVRTRETKEM